MTVEHLLSGGRSAAQVRRIGQTVHRSPASNAAFVHQLLRFLEFQGYPGSPRFLGSDDQGREVLSYIAGEVRHGGETWTGDQLRQVVLMLRALHDATAGSALAGDREVVCHHDAAPWNTVVAEGRPVAFIDFDQAAPGDRVEDLAYCLWTFLEIGGAEPVARQAARLRELSDVYGHASGPALLSAIQAQQALILDMRLGLAHTAADPTARAFSAERALHLRAEIAWLRAHRDELLRLGWGPRDPSRPGSR